MSRGRDGNEDASERSGPEESDPYRLMSLEEQQRRAKEKEKEESERAKGVEGAAQPESSEELPVPVEGEGLLSGFDEDDDFETDPEVEAAMGGGGPGAAAKPDPAGEELPTIAEWFVLPGLGNWRTITIFGVLLAVLAAVLSSAGHEARPLAQSIYTLYQVALQTGTGVLAVVIAARLSERRVNQPELAAARMLVATAALNAIFYAQTPIPMWLQYPVAVGAYLGSLWLLFKLPRFETLLLAGVHFVLWLLMRVGGELEVLLQAPMEG